MIMLRHFSPCILRGCTSSSCVEGLSRRRVFSTDHSHEKPAAVQLEHVQKRLVDTVPLMFRQRMDYTFYRKDVFCDDQIFCLKKYGLDQLMQHFGTISTLGQFSFPHIEMEAVSVVPVIEDGTVRCRWRIKYISFPRLLSNYRLFFREYRKENLSWFDGYSVLTIDGNGQVYKITIQRTQRDETALMSGKSTKDRLVEKIAIFRPRPSAATHFMPHKLDSNTGRGNQE